MIIRLSPSGPPIANAEGATAEVGPGFQLRMSEDTGSTNAATIAVAADYASDNLGNAFVVGFDVPDPNKRYAINCHFQAEAAAAGNAAIKLEIVASYDGGADVVVGTSVTHLIASTPGSVFADVGMVLGSQMLNPIPPGTTSVLWRARVSADAANFKLAQNASFWLSAKELL